MDALVARMKELGMSDYELQQLEELQKQRLQEAWRGLQEARLREQEARQREHVAKQREQVARQREQEARQKEQDAKQREQEAKQREQEAEHLLEIQLQKAKQRETRSVLQYFKEGSKLRPIRMFGSESGASTNRHHEPIASKTMMDFGVIEILPDDVAHCAERATDVFSLDQLTGSTEADVQSYVNTVIVDIVFAAKASKELNLRRELGFMELRSDFWIVSCCGYPVGAVKVKIPGKIKEASWDSHYGQLYDHLLRIRSFHGIGNVIGLFTNWNEWVFGWLEDSDISATATDLEYTMNNDVTLSTDRTLHISQKYHRDDLRSLASALFSWVKKLVRNSQSVAPMPLLNGTRPYVKLIAEKWVWKPNIPVTELSLWPPRKGITSFYLLRDFHGGADGRVWLACHVENRSSGDREGKLAVIKFLTNSEVGREEETEKEVARWHMLGVDSVYATRLCGRQAIVMPLGFHYNSERTINSKWWDPHHDNLSPPIKDFCQIFAMVSNCVAEEVLDGCMRRCAAEKLAHSDIEWRHVTIFPKMVSTTFSLEYCFIDLTFMTEEPSEEAAMAKMEGERQRLLLL